MLKLQLLKLRPLLREHQLICIKATYSNSERLGSYLKVAILTSYKKWSVGYFELKLHIHTLGISETYFTSCKKEHNRSPLKENATVFPYSNMFFPQLRRVDMYLSRERGSFQEWWYYCAEVEVLRSALPPHIIVIIVYPLRKSPRFILCHHTYSCNYSCNRL